MIDAVMTIANSTPWAFAWSVAAVNEQQLHLLQGAQDMINGILENMESDPYHAPADWILENIWNTLEAVKNAQTSV